MIINEGRPGKKLPTLANPGVAGDLLSGKQLIGQDGNIITGTIPSKTSTDISVSGRTVTVPAGYYPSQASKSIASATQATPSITVSTGGLITASATQSAGYVASGTKSATKQLTTQAGKTVTPGTSQQTAVASGRYTTGTVYVAGDADLKAENIKSGVSIFGVAGSYGGSGVLNRLSPSNTQNRTHTALDVYMSEYSGAGLTIEDILGIYVSCSISYEDDFYDESFTYKYGIVSLLLYRNEEGHYRGDSVRMDNIKAWTRVGHKNVSSGDFTVSLTGATSNPMIKIEVVDPDFSGEFFSKQKYTTRIICTKTI